MSRRGSFIAPLPAGLALVLAAVALAADPSPSAPPAPSAAPASPPVSVSPPAPPSAPAAAATQAETEAELPTLQPGMWAYERTVTSENHKPAQSRTSKCGDPTADMRKKVAELKQKGCRFSPTIHFAGTYRSSWACPTHGGVLILAQVLTVTGDNRYEDSSEARFEEQLTRTKIVATRVGDCPLLPGVPKSRPRPPPLPAPGGTSPPGRSSPGGG